jgi:hypothetical protein
MLQIFWPTNWTLTPRTQQGLNSGSAIELALRRWGFCTTLPNSVSLRSKYPAEIPLVSPAMFERAERDFRQFGIWGVSMGPVRGIPYKVYAVEAPAHSALWPFLLVTVSARLWRLLPVWMGFAAAGVILRKLGRASLSPALHALFWIATYLVYWATLK